MRYQTYLSRGPDARGPDQQTEANPMADISQGRGFAWSDDE